MLSSVVAGKIPKQKRCKKAALRSTTDFQFLRAQVLCLHFRNVHKANEKEWDFHSCKLSHCIILYICTFVLFKLLTCFFKAEQDTNPNVAIFLLGAPFVPQTLDPLCIPG